MSDELARAPGQADAGQATAEDAHPGNSVYLIVAAFLVVLTAMEVTVFYVRAIRPIMVPVLIILSGAKFALVVLFFMHLRYDARRFSFVLGFAMTIAGAIVLALFFLLPEFYRGY
ncbi:MAG TPA: cytochrome C oxidase subunit IV family protein [Candidatus Binataceae bacterium]|jgi:cytochrome c oxidase subunit 4